MSSLNQLLKVIILFSMTTIPHLLLGQYMSTSCQTVTDALIGPDRNDFVHDNDAFPINEGYLHNFTPPSFPCDPGVTSLLITIDIMTINTSPACDGIPLFGNILRNCDLTTTAICGITEDALTPGCGSFGGGQTTPGFYSLDLANCEAVNNSDVIGVDIIPSGCSTSAITDGDVALTYEICIQYTYDQDIILVDPGNCDDGDCSNGIEVFDGCGCAPGTTPVDPGCNDGDCTNGVETWDGCNCVAGTTPVDPGNCDDGDCANGVESWDGCNCVAGTPPVDPFCDDGDCTNGTETWDGCDCIPGTPPVNPGNCDDSDCLNGVETWDGCDCIPGTPPVDPGNCDDGNCLNGVETFDGCGCIPGTPPVDPGNCDDGDCLNGVETWDGCDCVAGTPPVNPGNCDDGDCLNGVETWDGCDCVAGTPPVDPFCDDGDCLNGVETWDGCDCVAGTPPVNPGNCDDGDCLNGVETWDGCDCVAGTPPVNPGNCDDGDCSNGVETWNGCDCVAGAMPVDPGCDDGDCTNGTETWNGCDCVAGTPPTPCVDDNDCTNGIEVWNVNTCECDITPQVTGCTDPDADNYNPAATCDDGSCGGCSEPVPGCDDGNCANGLETWNTTLCECVAGTAPVDPGNCDDGDCTNGTETWNGCDCIAGTPPTPCVDDNDCTNGIEVWNINTCECDITPQVTGCTDPDADNYNPAATCDDGSCGGCSEPVPGCDDGNCANGLETWDITLCECIAGTAPVDPGCDDGDCTNGTETWNGCDCVAGTPPTPCVDDNDCTNGIEVWNVNTCECDITPQVTGCTDPDADNYNPAATCDDGSCGGCSEPVPGCDDGNCANGLETWDATLCECVAGTAPVDPGCDDGDCTNGTETWNGCDCIAGTPPTPCVDDNDCTNGIEVWNINTCECDITPQVTGCTDPDADNYNPAATCDDGSCGGCSEPVPGCDDGNCANGLETWDATLCECVAGTAPVDPGCDDGDCTNGTETWNGCDCVAGTPPTPCVDDNDCTNGIEVWNINTCECDITPQITGCTDPDADNYNPAATCDDGSCGGCSEPVPGCDDGDCTNGTETWDTTLCECVAGTAPVDPGCDDGDCTNGTETWNGCDCVAGTPPTPCVDDNDCTNGIEVWNINTCECDITPQITGCTDPDADNYNPAATCDDGSCGGCSEPVPGCDDGNCTNGTETWDTTLCECVAGTAPVDPGCDDGDCTNGTETWDGCDCIAGTPVDCTNGTTSVVECDDNDANTINDVQTILDCGGEICIPCAGVICDVIVIIPQPSSTITCENLEDGVVLEGTGSSTGPDISYEWIFDNQVIGNTIDIEVFADGIYTLQVTNNSLECTNSENIDLTIDEVFLDPQIDVFSVTCPGQNDGSVLVDTVFGGSSPYLYAFNSNAFGPNNLFENLAAGDYELSIQDANGCETTVTVKVLESNSLFVSLGEDDEIRLGDSIELNALNNLNIDTIIWDFDESLSCLDCPNPTVLPLISTAYSVTITDTTGCSLSDQITIFVNGTANIYIPSAFSPDNNGINDKLIIDGGSDVRMIRSFRVYDRWGEELYFAGNFLPGDIDSAWDGLYNGQELQSGVYVYYAEIEFVDNRVEVIRGDVTIFR